MARLYVNVDHVATLREARKTVYPDPVEASLRAENAGADGITVHLREDRRHIQDADVENIKDRINSPLNLEMAAVDEMIAFARKIVPHQVSLVPEKRQEITTEGGLDVVSNLKSLQRAREAIKEKGILFSLFVDPSREQIEASREAGADSIEINTGRYSELDREEEVAEELNAIKSAARFASEQGLKVFAGHGLTTNNVRAIAGVPEIEELNIGHFLVARSVYIGLDQAIQEMREAIRKATGHAG